MGWSFLEEIVRHRQGLEIRMCQPKLSSAHVARNFYACRRRGLSSVECNPPPPLCDGKLLCLVGDCLFSSGFWNFIDGLVEAAKRQSSSANGAARDT